MLQEFYPLPYEIDLAIERTLAYKHVEDNPYILSKFSNPRTSTVLPSFAVPPYVLGNDYSLPFLV